MRGSSGEHTGMDVCPMKWGDAAAGSPSAHLEGADACWTDD